jgi:hypothetical protein
MKEPLKTAKKEAEERGRVVQNLIGKKFQIRLVISYS